MFMNYWNLMTELKKIVELIIDNITHLGWNESMKWLVAGNICGILMVIRFTGFYMK